MYFTLKQQYSQTSPYVNLSKMESLLGCKQNAYKYSYKNTPTIQTPDTKLWLQPIHVKLTSIKRKFHPSFVIHPSVVLDFLLDRMALWVGGLRKVGINLQFENPPFQQNYLCRNIEKPNKRYFKGKPLFHYFLAMSF